MEQNGNKQKLQIIFNKVEEAFQGLNKPQNLIEAVLKKKSLTIDWIFYAYSKLGEIECLSALSEVFEMPLLETVEQLNEMPYQIDYERIERIGFLFCWKFGFCPLKIEGREYFLATTPFPLLLGEKTKVVLVPTKLFFLAFREVKFSRFLGTAKTKPSRFTMDLFIDYLLLKALAYDSSDIHLFYNEEEQVTQVFFRVMGKFVHIEDIEIKSGFDEPIFHLQLANKLYLEVGKDTQVYRTLVDGIFPRRLYGKTISVRLSSIPVLTESREYIPSIVLRLLKTSEDLSYRLDKLGFNEKSLTLIRKYKDRPHGIFLVVGPTGSGKTTTLYSILGEKTHDDVCLLTVEDPVEIRLPKTRQIEINPQANLTFASVMKAFLRHDPDVMLVGEIRDAETAQIAIEAALTGHLVFATVHVNDAYSVVARFTETLKINPRILFETLLFVVSQRLVRTLCPRCRQKVDIEALKPTFLSPDIESYEKILKDIPLYIPKGCPECLGTGYVGRSVVYEILPFTSTLKAKWLATISEGGILSYEEVFRLSQGIPFGESAIEKLKKGLMSLSDIEKAVGPLPEVLMPTKM